MNSVSENSVNPTAPEVIVSIIIVSWNARDYLMQCLASITPRSCKYPFEIIVVDNGSSDESPECVERSFPYVRLLRNKSNLGFAKANNMGISLSTGRYLCLVNSDVKVQDECITRLVDFCMEHRGETYWVWRKLIRRLGLTNKYPCFKNNMARITIQELRKHRSRRFHNKSTPVIGQ